MKKIFAFVLLLVLAGTVYPLHMYSQSVAINADSSAADQSAILDLKSTSKGMLVPRMTMVQRNAVPVPAMGLLIYQTDNTPGFYYYDGSAWSAVKGTGGGGGSDPYWSIAGASIFTSGSVNVGIGTSAPATKLTVQTPSGNYGLAHTDGTINLTTYVGGGSNGGWLGTTSNHPLYFFTNNSPPRMAITGIGFVGVGVEKPVNKFQVGTFDGATSSTAENLLTLADQGGWLAINESAPSTTIYANNNILINSLAPNGNIGLATSLPANKVQIGDMGTVGFTGNHLAIGNGNAATAFNQYDNYFQVASNKDFVFLPRAGVGGRVGINTSTPISALDVRGFVTSSNYRFAYLGLDHNITGYLAQTAVANTDADISIYASNNIMALQMDVFSDARIKDIRGGSDSKKDLAILKLIKVTDYTFKDKVRNGTHPSKKVIAQQVEKIYPQIVSRHTDFIPNVYQPADSVTKVGDNYLLSFKNNHHLGDTAQKIQVLLGKENHFESFDIVSIPSSKEVIISGREIKNDQVFVYGEQVTDFRTVDYDGLTTLNISATQQLGKEVDELKRALKLANENIRTLARLVEKQNKPLLGKRLAVARMSPQKANIKKSKQI